MVCCYTIVEWEYMNFKININNYPFPYHPLYYPEGCGPGDWYWILWLIQCVIWKRVCVLHKCLLNNIPNTDLFFLSYKGLLWIYIGQGRCYWYSRLVIAVWKKKPMFYYYVHVCNNKKMQWCFNIRYIKTQAEFNEKDCSIQGSE